MCVSVIIVMLVVIILLAVVKTYIVFPVKDTIEISLNEPYYITVTSNYCETQKKFECAGYSTAYVLRSLGLQVSGDEVYTKIKNKLPFGLVLPKSIISFFQTYKFKTKYYYGSLDSLKSRLQKGVPIIVFIKVFKNKGYYHYIPLTGFTKDTLLFAESLDFLQNTNIKNGNREIKNQLFPDLWNVSIPFHTYTYIAIETKS